MGEKIPPSLLDALGWVDDKNVEQRISVAEITMLKWLSLVSKVDLGQDEIRHWACYEEREIGNYENKVVECD